MTNAVFQKRLTKLEAEIKRIKALLPRVSPLKHIDMDSPSFKKLPRGVQAGLRELKQGKIIGPFDSTKAFMADLKA